MRGGRKAICACISLIVVLAAAVAACSERNEPSVQTFPAAALQSFSGNDVLALETWRGKVLVVNFWATWCEPCRKEMASLERLHRLADPEKLAVIGLSVDTDQNLAREFLLQHKLTFPNYSDHEQKLARDVLGVKAFPATFVVAADGTIMARVTGARDWASAEALEFLVHVTGTPGLEKYSRKF